MADCCGFKKKDISIRYQLEVEYVDDIHVWDKIVNEKCAPYEPWELYKKKVFNDIGDGISFYLCCLFNEQIYDEKLFFSTFINNEMVEERYIEPVSTLYSSLANMINCHREKEIDELRSEVDQKDKLLRVYQDFIKNYHAEKEFERFLKLY